MDNPVRLRAWRERAGLTLGGAARLLDATHPAWLSWESGQKRPSYPHAVALERLTSGEVPAAGWLSAEERAAIEAVVPVPAPAPEQAA